MYRGVRVCESPEQLDFTEPIRTPQFILILFHTEELSLRLVHKLKSILSEREREREREREIGRFRTISFFYLFYLKHLKQE